MGVYWRCRLGLLSAKCPFVYPVCSGIKEKIDFNGPVAMIGIRFKVSKKGLFVINKKEVFPSLCVRFIRQFDLQNKQSDVGGVQVLFGLLF